MRNSRRKRKLGFRVRNKETGDLLVLGHLVFVTADEKTGRATQMPSDVVEKLRPFARAETVLRETVFLNSFQKFVGACSRHVRLSGLNGKCKIVLEYMNDKVVRRLQ